MKTHEKQIMSQSHPDKEYQTTADMRRIYPTTLIWGYLDATHKVPVYYDHKLNFVSPFTDYCTFLAKKKIAVGSSSQAYKSFIDAVAYALKDFLDFLRHKNLNWLDANDSLIADYRDWSLAETEKGKVSRNSLSAKRSTNIRLSKVYEFYYWAQSHALLTGNMIGWQNEKIKSSLGRFDKMKKSGSISLLKNELYPLSFTGVGEGSRSRPSKFLTEVQRDRIVEELLKSGSEYTKKRNLLLFRIAEAVGLRRASICSLTTDQFQMSDIEEAIESNSKFEVVPASQKFGYQNPFSIPIPLALAISKYCNEARAIHLNNLNIDEKTAKNRLFLSDTTGAPIENSTITHVVGTAIKKIVPSKGMGPHSLRDTYSVTRMANEISFRKRNGLSLAPEDLGLALAADLGHKSIKSQGPYTSAMRLAGDEDIEQVQFQKILEQKLELDKLRVEISNLQCKK